MKQRKRIIFDVDGVLADFIYAFSLEAVALGLLERPITTYQQKQWNFPWSKEDLNRVWAVVDETPWWWLDAVPALFSSDEAERIHELSERHEVYFCTARAHGTGDMAGANVQRQTALWLQEYNLAASPTVIIQKEKGPLAAALHATHAIDDKPEHVIAIKAARPKCKTRLITRPYNELTFYSDRVTTLGEFLDLCEGGKR